MNTPGSTVWRDYETDGVPSSGAHQVKKSDVRTWSAAIEADVAGVATAAATAVAAAATATADLTAINNNLNATANTATTAAAAAESAATAATAAASTANATTWAIIAIGESNSAGNASNGDLTTPELAPRSAVQMLNVLTWVFEPLHIGLLANGGNNNLDHYQVPNANNYHGWEAGLADEVEAGTWVVPQVYYIQAGQGGSHVAADNVVSAQSDWVQGGYSFEKFRQRWRVALDLFRTAGLMPIPVVWMSIGINDSIGGSSTGAFKTGLVQFFADIRSVLGYCPIVIDQIPTANSAGATAPSNYTNAEAFNQIINDVVAADPFAFLTRTADVTLASTYHWGTAAMKTIASRKAEIVLKCVGSGFDYAQRAAIAERSSRLADGVRPIRGNWECGFGAGGLSDLAAGVMTWVVDANATDAGSGRLNLSATLPSGGVSKGAYDTTKAFSFIAKLPSNLSTDFSNIVVCVDDNPGTAWKITNNPFTTTKPFVGGFLISAGNYYSLTNFNDQVNLSIAATGGDWVKFTGNGSDLVLQYSSDGGTTWNALHTYTSALLNPGVHLGYVKVMAGAGSSTAHLTVTPSLQNPV
jgi:hypothetical protein